MTGLTGLIIAIVYFALLIGVLAFLLTKKVKSVDDYMRAGQQLSWPLVMFTLTLGPLGGGHTLSLWEASDGMGVSVLWWAIVAGGIFLPIFMLWFGPWVRQLKVDTFPEVLEKLFGKTMSWVNACVSPAAWIGLAAAEIVTTATAIYALAGGAISFAPWCILLAFALTLLYVYFAGMLQMAWMNVVNAIVMIVGSYLALIFTGVWVAANLGGWTAISDFYINAGQSFKLEIFNFTPELWFSIIIPVFVLHISSASVDQAKYIPVLAAKSDSEVRKGVFWGSIINFMAAFPWVIMGMVGMAIPAVAAFGPKLSVPEFALMALPAPIVGLLMISLLSACLSTGSGIILAIAQVISKDVIKRAICPDISEKKFLTLNKVMVVVSSLLALIPALTVPIIYPIFLWCFSFGIPIFVVFLTGMKWKISKPAAWITIIAAYLVNFVWTFWTPAWAQSPFDLNMYPVTIISLVLGIILTAVLPGKPGLRSRKSADNTSITS